MDRDDSDFNSPSSPAADDDSIPEEQRTLAQRLFAALFPAHARVDPGSQRPAHDSPLPQQPSGQQPSNNVVPFFSASTVLDRDTTDPPPQAHATPSSAPMQRAQHVVFCVEDTVGLLDDKFSVGIVDRSFGDVDSHEPRPQNDYSDEIARNHDVPQADFASFMKTGIPPRGTVLVSWQTQLKTELLPEAKLQLLDRALYVGDVVKRSSDEHMSGTVIGTRTVCTLFPATMFNATMFNTSQITQQISDDLSIRNVPADELTIVHEFSEGSMVV